MTTALDLPGPWAREPYLAAEHGRDDVLAAAADDDAMVAVVSTQRRGPWLIGLGAPAGVAALLDREHDALLDAGMRGATLTRGAWELVAPASGTALALDASGSDWDWMWTHAPLDVDPTGAYRLPPGERTLALVGDCLARAYPSASTAPDDDRLLGWWGVPDGADHEDPARLVAVVGAVALAPGLAPHLVSLAVDPAERGRGHADRVLAAAVRDGLQVRPVVGEPLVSLGMYASNAAARRVYERLGFVLRHTMSSRERRRD